CLLATTLACRRGIPGHLGVKPDRQRAPALERFIVGWPVPGLVIRGCVSAHASQLPHWIHEMNASPDLCNRAAMIPSSVGFSAARLHGSHLLPMSSKCLAQADSVSGTGPSSIARSNATPPDIPFEPVLSIG